jgi:hypothetical protein
VAEPLAITRWNPLHPSSAAAMRVRLLRRTDESSSLEIAARAFVSKDDA